MKPTWIATTITLLFAYTVTSAPVNKECTGNKAHDVRLDKVILTQGSEEVGEPVWTSMDEAERLSKVMVLQQDLNQVKENILPDNFTFR
ncbi:hypothetical protein INT45_002342 [Circinella minor]|uniref:Uncharacterized protein n=1 Tax=Circinella minor TaxID=1195481 RepID=A0A8H7S0B2_9FUNG|nr:hypothetical protein INT45_002342 [Circinella minor]